MFIIAGYRDWAWATYNGLKQTPGEFVLVRNPEELRVALEKCGDDEVEAIFFVGWSQIVDALTIETYDCYCLHPSDLPKYRGGSPIQNQILDGVLDSKMTLFKMDHGIDTGPIFKKNKIWFTGSMEDIFDILHFAAFYLIREVVDLYLNGKEIPLTPQDELEATYYKRRKPVDSEITFGELITKDAAYFERKIRMLQDPYPNAYIKCSDGRKLYITEAHAE
jgi:methionyl-tRNA formyltransferase